MKQATGAIKAKLPASASALPTGHSSTQDYLRSLPPLRTLLQEAPISRDLKRRILALIVQADLFDCLNDSGEPVESPNHVRLPNPSHAWTNEDTRSDSDGTQPNE